MLRDSVVEKDQDSGAARADDAGQAAGRAQDDRQCPVLGAVAVADDQVPRVEQMARELGQARADS